MACEGLRLRPIRIHHAADGPIGLHDRAVHTGREKDMPGQVQLCEGLRPDMRTDYPTRLAHDPVVEIRNDNGFLFNVKVQEEKARPGITVQARRLIRDL